MIRKLFQHNSLGLSLIRSLASSEVHQRNLSRSKTLMCINISPYLTPFEVHPTFKTYNSKVVFILIIYFTCGKLNSGHNFDWIWTWINIRKAVIFSVWMLYVGHVDGFVVKLKLWIIWMNCNNLFNNLQSDSKTFSTQFLLGVWIRSKEIESCAKLTSWCFSLIHESNRS